MYGKVKSPHWFQRNLCVFGCFFKMDGQLWLIYPAYSLYILDESKKLQQFWLNKLRFVWQSLNFKLLNKIALCHICVLLKFLQNKKSDTISFKCGDHFYKTLYCNTFCFVAYWVTCGKPSSGFLMFERHPFLLCQIWRYVPEDTFL